MRRAPQLVTENLVVPRAPLAEQTGAVADFDTQLMLQVRAGNNDAAGMLVRRNLERVARFVGRIVRNERHVEDIAQEVFLQVLAAAPRYEPTARFSTWLYRIAMNAALDHLAQPYHKRRRESQGDQLQELAGKSREDPQQAVSMAELRGQIHLAIAALPVNQRVALTLFQFEDMSYEQIASVMEISVDGVRSLLARARRALRTQLQDLM